MSKHINWFLDTEFNDDGKTIDLISIALVSEDGREYYAVSSDFSAESCNDWVKANVLPLLPDRDAPSPANSYAQRVWKSRATIATELRELLLGGGVPPAIWGYFSSYDWVAFCQLYGPMVSLPFRIPRFCRELKQLMDAFGLSKSDLPPQVGAVHHALEDARWIRDSYKHIRGEL